MNLSPQQKQDIYQYIDQNRKIDAVKYLTENFGISLKQAKIIVDRISEERTESPQYQQSHKNQAQINKRVKPVLKGKALLAIFLAIGLPMAGLAVYFGLETGEKVGSWIESIGMVTGMQGGSDGGSAPVITYEYNGATYNYQSSIYSSPPAYEVGEEVGIFINPDEPTDILINTFSEKWLFTLIFGIMGIMFIVIPTFVVRATSSLDKPI